MMTLALAFQKGSFVSPFAFANSTFSILKLLKNIMELGSVYSSGLKPFSETSADYRGFLFCIMVCVRLFKVFKLDISWTFDQLN